MPKKRRLRILCTVLAQTAQFLKGSSPFRLLLFFPLPLPSGTGVKWSWIQPQMNYKSIWNRGLLKSPRLHCCPKAGSTASNPFLRDIYLSCFLKSPVMETPQSTKVIPSSASDVLLESKLNHPCWELSLLLSTENKITSFSPSLQRCETRLVFLWTPFSKSASFFKFQTPNWTLFYSQDFIKAKLEWRIILHVLQIVVPSVWSRTVLLFSYF